MHPDHTRFRCAHCGRHIPAPDGAAPGTRHRNHCPHCLWSVHLDRHPGDRAARCGGQMEPVAVAARRDGEWSLVHRCRTCGSVGLNRIAGDDNELALVALAVRPLAATPFPLDTLQRLTHTPDPS